MSSFSEEAPLLTLAYMGASLVASFFLLAGYGLAFSDKKGEAYLHGFFKKRLVRLWPLFFMTIVYQSYKAYHNNFDWDRYVDYSFTYVGLVCMLDIIFLFRIGVSKLTWVYFGFLHCFIC